MARRALLGLLLVCCVASCAFGAKFANDPTRLSIGARVLGMGTSFTGLADDTSAIFLNPAGLGRINEWQVSSMSGKFINIFDYVQLSALYPTSYGTFGLGYGGSSIEFRYPSSEVIVIGDDIRIVPTGEVTGKYANTALLFSYGRQFSIYGLKGLSLGGSLKLLSQDLSASVGGAGTASGMELNLGALYPYNEDLTLGLSVINALPASMGGKITWTTNTEESLPAILRAGFAYRLLTEVADREYKFNFTGDYEQYLTRSDVPALLHGGVEWFPIDFAALRLGLDQSQSADTSGNVSVSNDLTYGLSLFMRGFKFDFAYHTYNDIPDNATSYFSLSYSPEKEEPKVEKQYISITAPVDGSVVYDARTMVQGKVLDREAAKVLVQDKEVEIDPRGTFAHETDLGLGRNFFLVKAYDKDGKFLKQINLRVIRLVTFKDLKEGYWAKLPIEQLATLKIISGYPDETFRPEATINRAELVTLLMKIKGTRVGGRGTKFSDVPAGHWAASYISQAVGEGVVKGYPDGTYRPAKAINRAEGISVIARFAKLPESRVLEAPYPDVPGRHWAVSSIAAAKEAGLLDYIKDGFKPNAALSRGEVAYVLSKTELVSGKIKDLTGK